MTYIITLLYDLQFDIFSILASMTSKKMTICFIGFNSEVDSSYLYVPPIWPPNLNKFFEVKI